jgi:chondroitin 4-sulfotransferase 11
MLKKLNYFIESKRVEKGPGAKSLVLIKDLTYLPVHYLCEIKGFRKFFFHLFGTTGRYEPKNRGIVSIEKRFIFFFIPKVASTTIKKALVRALFDKIINARVHCFWFNEVIDVKKGEYPDYFKFTFVRNPWDRILSCYSDTILHEDVTNYKYKNGVFRRYVRKYKNLFYRGMPFEEFVRVISRIPDERADRHFRSQHSFITDENDNILVDFIGRFEKLSKDLAFLSEKTDFKDMPFFHENKSKREKDYRMRYTEETRRLVAERYKNDIKLFDYRFQS